MPKTIPPSSTATLNICPSSATIGEASPQPFEAWHSASGVDFGSCLSKNAASTDVTSLTLWSSTDPFKVSIGANDGNAIGVAAGFASINASYSGIAAAPAPVTVTAAAACPPKQCSDFAADIARTCTTKNYVAPDGCPGSGTVSCRGTRVCDYNWKEVAP